MNSIYRFILLGLLLPFCGCSHKEDLELEESKYIRIYGFETDDLAHDLVQLSDGGFAILGEQIDFKGRSTAVLIRTDADGSLRWMKRYDYRPNGSTIFHDLILLNDGYEHFVLAGEYTEEGIQKKALMINAKDNEVADTAYATYEFNYAVGEIDNALYQVQALDYGQLVAVGEINGGMWILHTNESLQPIHNNAWDIGKQSKAQSLIVRGNTVIACGQSHGQFIKRVAWNYDSGEKLWEDSSAIASPLLQGDGIHINNKMMVFGNSHHGEGNSDLTLLFTSPHPDSLLAPPYYFGGLGDDVLISRQVEQISENVFLVAGYSTSFGRGQKDIYLATINLSDTTVKEQHYGGRFYDDIAVSLIKTQDGFAICGHSNSFSFNAQMDIFLMKLDKNGHLQP
jgi:hypothetical protein